MQQVAEQVSREVFATYDCRSAARDHGRQHPGDIAEPASLAAIPLPPSGALLALAVPAVLLLLLPIVLCEAAVAILPSFCRSTPAPC